MTSLEGGYERTGSRSPMQWNHEPNAGFSQASADKLYLKQDEDPARPTVEDQMADPDSLWNEIKKLIEFRLEHEALSNCAEIKFLNVGYPLVYQRSCETESMTVIINPSSESQIVDVPSGTIVYTVGGTAQVADGKCHVNGTTAVFMKA